MSHVIYKWLHLSDIHFSEKAGFNTSRLRSSLLKYLKELREQYDCMVMSGDFRYALDKTSGTEEIVLYIKKLTENIGLSSDKIIMAPGNHDLKRNKARKSLATDTLNEYNPEDGKIDSSILDILVGGDTFKFFNDLKASITKNNKVISIKGNPHSIVDMGKCYWLVLNTAIVAEGGKLDERGLIIGSDYVIKLIDMIRDTPKPIIAVGHHGFDWFKEEERNELLLLFKQEGIKLYLCGHSNVYGGKLFEGKIAQITVGCIKQEIKIDNNPENDNNVEPAFSIGQLYSDGKVSVGFYEWDCKYKKWRKDETPPENCVFDGLYSIPDDYEIEPETRRIEKVEHPFTISKLVPFDTTTPREGVMYFWEKVGYTNRVESITFNTRLKGSKDSDDLNTSAYTISTSIGCILSAMKCSCKFCETGKNEFTTPLTAEDIALQCIFMALYDKDYCRDHPELRDHSREFAFMGQGEPGYHYDVVKKAILLNDIAMDKLGQTVSRYIISTFGNSDFLSSLIMDRKNKVFKNRVSVHFSLHSIGEDRDRLMPINKQYDYREFIKLCKKYYQLTEEKIGVAILLFNDYRTTDAQHKFNLTEDKLVKILKELDNEIFRIDLCKLNMTSVGRNNRWEESDNKYCELVKNKGFEVKIFQSFGGEFKSGCGMLSSNTEQALDVGDSTIRAFNAAVRLLNEVKKEYEETLLSSKEGKKNKISASF